MKEVKTGDLNETVIGLIAGIPDINLRDLQVHRRPYVVLVTGQNTLALQAKNIITIVSAKFHVSRIMIFLEETSRLARVRRSNAMST